MKRVRQPAPDPFGQVEAWRDALATGIANELIWWVQNYRARWGYRTDERPVYAPCRHCETELRADRLDLIAEHVERCPGLESRADAAATRHARR